MTRKAKSRNLSQVPYKQRADLRSILSLNYNNAVPLEPAFSTNVAILSPPRAPSPSPTLAICANMGPQQRESTPLIRFATRNAGSMNNGGGINDEADVPAVRRNANVRMNVVDDGVRGMNASRFGLLLMTLVSAPASSTAHDSVIQWTARLQY